MTERAAELIAVAGPQEGKRFALVRSPMVAGRDAACDIAFEESTVSRRQLALERLRDGWAMVNLSSQGTRVNGKKYKNRDKRLLLDTGDLVGVGAATHLLFVAEGDDAEDALREYVRP